MGSPIAREERDGFDAERRGMIPMGVKNLDQLFDFGSFLQSEREPTIVVEVSLKRLKSKEGIPIVTLDQLAEVNPRPDEAIFVKTVYDRFSGGLKSPRLPFPPA